MITTNIIIVIIIVVTTVLGFQSRDYCSSKKLWGFQGAIEILKVKEYMGVFLYSIIYLRPYIKLIFFSRGFIVSLSSTVLLSFLAFSSWPSCAFEPLT